MAWTAPRTWVTGEVVTAAQLNTHLRDNMLDLAQAFRLVDHISGQYYYGPGLSGATPSTATVAGRLEATPFLVPDSGAYDRIRIEGGGSGGNVRLGLYTDSGGLPDALTVESSEIAVASGAVEATISETLAPGVHWIASVFSSTPNVYKNQGQSMLTPALVPAAAGGVYRTYAYAALPDPFGTIDGYLGGGLLHSLRKT